MKKILWCSLILMACTVRQHQAMQSSKIQSFVYPIASYENIINQAMADSTGKVKAVLAETRKMVLMRQIVKGGCWHFLDTAWTNAGVPRHLRKTVYTDKIIGPYANLNLLKVGDWIYYVNHSYHDMEHSGMFLGWTEQSKNKALILSYAGEQRHEPARYREYDISHVYQIIRAQ